MMPDLVELVQKVRRRLYASGVSRSALKARLRKILDRDGPLKVPETQKPAVAPEVFTWPDGAVEGAPYISVIIASHNRQSMMIDLMTELQRQATKVAPIIEIVAVPNGCNDDSYDAAVSKFSLASDPGRAPEGSLKRGDRIAIGGEDRTPIIAYELKDGGLSNARNAGMAVARGKVIAFLDDDVRLDETWTKAVIEGFNDDRVGVLGGKIKLWLKGIKEPGHFVHYHRRLLGLNDWGDELIEVDPFMIFGGNFAMRRRVPAAVGEFSTAFGRIGDNRLAGEEADYFIRARDQRFRFFYNPEMAVEHLVDADRVTDDYIFRSARGVGMSRVRLKDRAHNMNSEMALSLLGKLHKMRLEYDRETDEAKRFENASQREDILGQMVSALDHLYGGRSEASRDALLSHPSLHADGYFDLEARSEKLRQQNRVLKAEVIDLSQTYKVSVIVVTHNDGLYLRQTLESVVTQSHEGLDIIVVDNASTDDSREIAAQYAARDKRVRTVHLEANDGPSVARNKGLELAAGEFVQFLDGDDFLLADSIAIRVATLRMAFFPDVAGAYCGSKAVHDVDVAQKSEKQRGANKMIDFLAVGGDCPFPIHAPLTKTSIVRKFGGFAEGVDQAEDWDLWSRILRHGYCYAPSGFAGVAYRQKLKTSLIKSDPVTHSDNARILFFAANEPIQEDSIVPDTPFVFRKPVSYYRDELAFADREFRHGVLDALNRSDAISSISARLPEDIRDLFLRRADMYRIITDATARVHSSYGHFAPFIDFFGRRRLNDVFGDAVKIDIDEALNSGARKRAEEMLAARKPIADVKVFGNDQTVALASIRQKPLSTVGLSILSMSSDNCEAVLQETGDAERAYVQLSLPDFMQNFAARFSVTIQSRDCDTFELSSRLGSADQKSRIRANIKTGEVDIDRPDRSLLSVEVKDGKARIEGVFFGAMSTKEDGHNHILVSPVGKNAAGGRDGRSFSVAFNHVSYSTRS